MASGRGVHRCNRRLWVGTFLPAALSACGDPFVARDDVLAPDVAMVDAVDELAPLEGAATERATSADVDAAADSTDPLDAVDELAADSAATLPAVAGDALASDVAAWDDAGDVDALPRCMPAPPPPSSCGCQSAPACTGAALGCVWAPAPPPWACGGQCQLVPGPPCQ